MPRDGSTRSAHFLYLSVGFIGFRERSALMASRDVGSGALSDKHSLAE